MPIAKGLALKVLGALAVGGSVVGGGIVLGNHMSKGTDVEDSEEKRDEKKPEDKENNTPEQDTSNTANLPKEDPEISKLLEDLGLKCGADNFCILAKGKSLSVKQEDNKSGTLTALPAEGAGKIKIHKAEEDKKNSTFSIEGGDITPT